MRGYLKKLTDNETLFNYKLKKFYCLNFNDGNFYTFKDSEHYKVFLDNKHIEVN